MSRDSEQWGKLEGSYLECRSPAPEQGRACISPWVWQRKIFWDYLGGKGQVGCSLCSLVGSAVNGGADPSLRLPHPGAAPTEATLG